MRCRESQEILRPRKGGGLEKLYRTEMILESPHIMYLYIPGTQMSLVLIGKDLLLEAKQRTNGFQVYILLITCI